MVNEEHLKILKQGVEAWNQWREENPAVRPNLFNADLFGARLSGAHLRKVGLFGADLRGALLQRTDLDGADLYTANLHRADLSGANLREAILRAANLTEAQLDEADLSEADVGFTIFANVDLSTVRGMETIKHHGPSTIGIDTIYRSKGTIPAEFLRGAGVPDNFIEYMSSLVGTAFEFYSCFISYSGKDQEFAARIHADLQDNGVRCWFAPQHVQAGKKLYEQIDDAIRLHERLLLILSPDSIDSE